MGITLLMDENELQSSRYVCIVTDHELYNLAIIHSSQFCGKSLVFSILNAQMVLMSQEDIEDPAYWMEKLGVVKEDIEEIQAFFYTALGQRESVNAYY
ncbi:hypothetical protein AC623_16135 [Bacillus sp. FJAT-27231]|uniref:SAV0927 family protein n=1 Tax=Bacillus sp. FJAT-27231 TaxID=1679168 RepID=UPI00067132EA|nr:SAV0927 family protein [Bacillus sp. FJAT-27231]KMY55271.1 hypothetical protein AC623_16135 [Bacillus sp. FJAT-27231]